MLTMVRGSSGRATAFARLLAFIKNLLSRRQRRLSADMLSPRARRDLLLPDPPPDPRGPWY